VARCGTKELTLLKLLTFGEILILGHFSLNLYIKRIKTWHFSESSGCRLSIAVYTISIGQLQLEKSGFKERIQMGEYEGGIDHRLSPPVGKCSSGHTR
jgi:hypothetical protein